MAYSSAGALKNSQTSVRVRSTSVVAASDVGLLECGLPSTRAAQELDVGVDLAGRVQPAARVVEVHLADSRRGARTPGAAATSKPPSGIEVREALRKRPLRRFQLRRRS